MKSTAAVPLLLLLLIQLNSMHVDALCALDKPTSARCHELEDARYINTYHLHALRAPSFTSSLGPGNFRNLTSLRHLDLSGGGIEEIESGSFAKLASLQSLDLTENRISQLDSGAFDGLKNLHSLRLGSNKIKQLPAALLSLKELRLLDLSNNPIDCNCASLKMRDALLARGVKISKKTQCSEPASLKHASILKPDTKLTCELEEQDLEMQADQPVIAEGSGEVDEALEEADKDDEEKELEQPEQPVVKEDEEEAETAAPSSSTEASSTASSTSEESAATEAASSSTASAKDDITFEEDSKKESTTETLATTAEHKEEDEDDEDSVEPEEILKGDEAIAPVYVSSGDTTTEELGLSSSSAQTIEAEVEGSGESDDDGSGAEGSGLLGRMPPIDFNETSLEPEEDEQPASTSSTTTTTRTTTPETSWIDALSSIWYGSGSSATSTEAAATTTTTTTTTTTEKSVEDMMREDQMLPTTPDTYKPEEPSSKQSPRTSVLSNEIQKDEAIDKSPGETASSTESKKGMGSYVVLAALLAILAALIGFAAYKGDFCRKKRKRSDVERGTEMKDMQRSLIEQNSQQPKIQASNGNTMENVPLMNAPSAPPDEPKDNQRSYDISPLPNGASKTNGPSLDANEPIKPPRKLPGQEIEAPLNGLNPPMEAIDAPLHNGSNGDLSNGEDYCDGPPLSPGAQRVKITMQDNPDSVPKTPILITRLKGGENLVKAP